MTDQLKEKVEKFIKELSKDYGGKTENQYIIQRLQKIIGTWIP